MSQELKDKLNDSQLSMDRLRHTCHSSRPMEHAGFVGICYLNSLLFLTFKAIILERNNELMYRQTPYTYDTTSKDLIAYEKTDVTTI